MAKDGLPTHNLQTGRSVQVLEVIYTRGGKSPQFQGSGGGGQLQI